MIYGKAKKGKEQALEKHIEEGIFSPLDLLKSGCVLAVCVAVIILEIIFGGFNLLTVAIILAGGYYFYWTIKNCLNQYRLINDMFEKGNYEVAYLPIKEKYFKETEKNKKGEVFGEWHLDLGTKYGDFLVDEEIADSYEDGDLFPVILYSLVEGDIKVMLVPDYMVERE